MGLQGGFPETLETYRAYAPVFKDKGVVYEQVDLNFKRLLLIFYLYISARVFLVCMKAVTHESFHTAKSAAMEESYGCFSSNFFQARAWSVCCNAIAIFLHQCCVNGVKCNSVKFCSNTSNDHTH